MDSQAQTPADRSAPAKQESTTVAEALELFRRLVYSYSPFNDPVWLKLNLTMAQLRGLRALVDGAATINEVAKRLGIAQPTASLLIDRLVRRGLVERVEDRSDRRRALATLTPEGERLIARLRGDRRERARRHLAQLADDDLAALIRGFRALVAAMGDETRPPAPE